MGCRGDRPEADSTLLWRQKILCQQEVRGWGEDGMKILFLIFLLIAFSACNAEAEDLTVYDEGGRVKAHVRDGVIYGPDGQAKGRIKDGQVYDRAGNPQIKIEDGKIYDRDGTPKGRIIDGKIYDRGWKRKGIIKKQGG